MECDQYGYAVIEYSDVRASGIWIGRSSVGVRALVDCVVGSIVCVYTGSGCAMRVRVLVVYNM